ncbi:MAG: hypothetical protein U0704_11140 [Candidatus Eisenbacteria bacterium]
MASSNAGPHAVRVRVGCDGCAARAWIAAAEPWCEGCQLAREAGAPACGTCGAPLARSTPRFVELFGELQRLDAVLHAWDGEPEVLARLLPARPRVVGDRTPPEARAGDAPALAALLAHVRAGRWRDALATDAADGARGHAARAIALERTGDAARALAEWSAALAQDDTPQSRLSRGALHAAAGDWKAAEADFARAGDTPAAGWNRAAAIVHRAVAKTPGLPDPNAVARARAEAGEPVAEGANPPWGGWCGTCSRSARSRAAKRARPATSN